MRILDSILNAFRRATSYIRGDLKVISMQGDQLPERFRNRHAVLMVDHGEQWSLGLNCPCGCGEVIELLLVEEVDQYWSLHIDQIGRPTLKPSIWKSTGCRSHFWVTNGQIKWCA